MQKQYYQYDISGRRDIQQGFSQQILGGNVSSWSDYQQPESTDQHQYQMNQHQLQQINQFQLQQIQRLQEGRGNELQESVHDLNNQIDQILSLEKVEKQHSSSLGQNSIQAQSSHFTYEFIQQQHQPLHQKNKSVKGNTQTSSTLDNLSLEEVIKQQHLINPSIVSVNWKLIIFNFLNRLIYSQYYSWLLKVISHQFIIDSRPQISTKIISKIFFYFIVQFLSGFSSMESENEKRIRGFQHMMSQFRYMIIYIISSPMILLLFTSHNLIYYLAYSIWLIALIYKILQLTFHFIALVILLDQCDSQHMKMSNNHADQFVHLILHQAYDKNITRDKSQLFVNWMSYQFSCRNQIEQLIVKILNGFESSCQVQKDKLRSGNQNSSKENKISELSQILKEVFKTYYTDKVRQLQTDKVRQLQILPDNQISSETQKLTSHTHPLITIKKIPKNFNSIQNQFFHQLHQNISTLVSDHDNQGLPTSIRRVKQQLINTRRIDLMCQIYHKYQSVVESVLIRELEKIVVMSHIQIDEQQHSEVKQSIQQLHLLPLSQKIMNMQTHSNHQLKPPLHELKPPLHELKPPLHEQVIFMNQLNQFYQVFLILISLKLNSIESHSPQQLSQLVAYIQQSISIKLFLLNSKLSCITNKSFGMFSNKQKSHNHPELQLEKADEQNQQSLQFPSPSPNSSQPVNLNFLPHLQKCSQYLTINHHQSKTNHHKQSSDSVIEQQQQQQVMIIRYEQFDKGQNVRETLDLLVEKLVEKRDRREEHNSSDIINGSEYSCDSKLNGGQLLNSSSKVGSSSYSSSDDYQQQNSIFNRPFNSFPINQPTSTKPNIFSKSQFQFNFNVQHEMSQLFSQLKSKQQVSSNNCQEIKQYQ